MCEPVLGGEADEEEGVGLAVLAVQAEEGGGVGGGGEEEDEGGAQAHVPAPQLLHPGNKDSLSPNYKIGRTHRWMSVRQRSQAGAEAWRVARASRQSGQPLLTTTDAAFQSEDAANSRTL